MPTSATACRLALGAAALAVLAGCVRETQAASPTTLAPVVPATVASNGTGTTSTTTGTTQIPTSTTSTTISTGVSTLPIRPEACLPTGDAIWERRQAAELTPPRLPAGWATEVIGTSVLGRDIVADVRHVDGARRRVIVVGGIHGNEPVSPPVVRGLRSADLPDDVEVWLVPEMNPDGIAAGTRCNANGVDLNRNFEWGWRSDDGGPAAFSEPEPQALRDLVVEVRPDVVVWVHQPYGYVSSIGDTPDAFEAAWSQGAGIAVRPDVTQHGGGESWTALVAGRPSMLIEVDGWAATQGIVDAQRAGFEALVGALG